MAGKRQHYIPRFLQTLPHGNAVALANTFANISNINRVHVLELSPNLSACEHAQADKFTPMPGRAYMSKSIGRLSDADDLPVRRDKEIFTH
ncbi:MAG: hypothetical protein QME06_05460 [Desulfobacterales bacterium]|nr:hypothetical protein [Desulfobacterales bacterium]